MLERWDRYLRSYVAVPSRITMISVDQDDIDLGCLAQGDSCPVQRAIYREMGAMTEVFVEHEQVTIDGVNIDLPGAVSAWIYRYDAGRPVEPLHFQLEVPA